MTMLKTPVNQETTTMKKAVNQKMMVLELAIRRRKWYRRRSSIRFQSRKKKGKEKMMT